MRVWVLFFITFTSLKAWSQFGDDTDIRKIEYGNTKRLHEILFSGSDVKSLKCKKDERELSKDTCIQLQESTSGLLKEGFKPDPYPDAYDYIPQFIQITFVKNKQEQIIHGHVLYRSPESCIVTPLRRIYCKKNRLSLSQKLLLELLQLESEQ